ncbi:MAG: hypothetical protein KAW92_09600 [Candidatus Cloacimonetes bacterium]|nr:hypothetical protein [Candidatus Cloacimonadota bacterium]
MNYILLTVWEFVVIIASVTLFSVLLGFWAGRLWGKFISTGGMYLKISLRGR